MGGLCLRSLRDMNQVLLAKLVWRSLQDRKATWAELLKQKYGVTPSLPSHTQNRGSFICQGMNWDINCWYRVWILLRKLTALLSIGGHRPLRANSRLPLLTVCWMLPQVGS